MQAAKISEKLRNIDTETSRTLWLFAALTGGAVAACLAFAWNFGSTALGAYIQSGWIPALAACFASVVVSLPATITAIFYDGHRMAARAEAKEQATQLAKHAKRIALLETELANETKARQEAQTAFSEAEKLKIQAQNAAAKDRTTAAKLTKEAMEKASWVKALQEKAIWQEALIAEQTPIIEKYKRFIEN